MEIYVRTGLYIRTRIERIIAVRRLSEPMFWEQWIASGRARALYYVSLAALQLPIAATVCLLGLVHAHEIAPELPRGLWRLHFSDGAYLFATSVFVNQAWRRIIEATVVIDLAVVAWMAWKAKHAEACADHLSLAAIEPEWPLPSAEGVTFVIPTKNDVRLSLTLQTLDHLAASAHESEVDILVCGETNVPMPSDRCRFVAVPGAAKGSCIRRGIEEATGGRVVICDADLPVMVRDLVTVIRTLSEVPVVWGHRYLRESGFLVLPPLSRRVASWIFRCCVRRRFPLLSGFDTQCGLKGFRAAVGRRLVGSCTATGLGSDVELALTVVDSACGLRHVPVLWKHRGGSTVRIVRDGWKMLLELRAIRRRRNVRRRD